MKTIHLLLFMFFLNSGWATTYYFSAVSGSDSRTSTQAQNSSTPWKTLNKLNSFFGSLKPGDVVLLKRGETFYGSIIVKKSGTSSSPITIGAYGTGNKPIITSLVKLGNWVSKSNGIWESYNSSLGSTVNMVLLNGVEQEIGRYPNSNASNKGYLTFESHVGKSSITDNQLTSAINWTGAQLVIRTRRWCLDRNLIKSHSGSKIYYTTSSIYEPWDGYGYFIQNSIKTLNKFGEWYYNPSTKKLSIYLGSNSPSSYTIQATTKTNLVSSANYSNVKFENLTIKGANGAGFNIASGSNININYCDILFSGQDGVIVNGHTSFKIENCTIANTNNNAIKLVANVSYSIVRNNKILNTALFAGMLVTGDGNGLGIYNNGDNNVIEYNEIRKTGHIGISFKGNNVTVKNNLIDSFCLTKDDGGGIYSYTDYIAYTGCKIIGNIVMNGTGALFGTGPSIYSTSGIYLDHGIAKLQIVDNTLVNCHDFGIYLHSVSNVTIRNNTLYNNSRHQLNITQSPGHDGSVRNNIINGNIFFAKYQTQMTSAYQSGANDISYFGKFDSNYYARPIDDKLSINNMHDIYPGVSANLDLAGWKNRYGDDPHSKITAKQIAPYTKSGVATNPNDSIKFVYNATKVNKTVSLSGSYIDTKGNKFSNSITLSPYKSAILIKTNSTVSTSPTVSITSPSNNSKFTSGTTIDIKASAADADGSISKVEIYKGTTLLKTEYTAPYTYTWQNVPAGNYTLTAKATDNSGHTTTSANVYISVTSNKAPTVSITSPSNNSKFSKGTTITIKASAADADGSISKVEIYRGTTLLKTEYTAPYTYSWGNVPAGNYTLTAKATDNKGLRTTSANVYISVTSTLARSISSADTASTADTTNTITEDTTNTIIGTNDSSSMSDSTNAVSKPSLSTTIPVSLKLAPNPATNNLNIVTSGLQQDKKLIISIYSISGALIRTIQSGTPNQVVQLDISSLSRGTYIVRVICGESVLSKQFVKLL